MMCEPRNFAYAHSQAVMAGLRSYADQRRAYIRSDYEFQDEPGEYTAFKRMLRTAGESKGTDTLYIESIKDLAGTCLDDFRKNLQAVEQARMKVKSIAEPHYDYFEFMTVIGAMESFTPMYQKSRKYSIAVGMMLMGATVEEVCGKLGISEAEVYEAMASYKRAEQSEESKESEE